jgi:hypothetical protein
MSEAVAGGVGKNVSGSVGLPVVAARAAFSGLRILPLADASAVGTP